MDTVFTTPAEFVRSEYFITLVTMLLDKVKDDKDDFDEEYFSWIFSKLQLWENLTIQERKDISDFISHPRVASFWRNLLWKLRKIKRPEGPPWLDGLNKFNKLLNSIFEGDWVEKIQQYVQEAANQTALILEWINE